jgi:DNA-binding response OmpR family regulator
MNSIRRALVVDDDDDLLRLCKATFETFTGWEVEVAHSTDAAMEAARCAPPDVILLDVMMPDGGGLSLLSRLKDYEATARIPVVLMTAAVTDAVECLTHGAAGLIPKPFDPAALPERIVQLLREAR